MNRWKSMKSNKVPSHVYDYTTRIGVYQDKVEVLMSSYVKYLIMMLSRVISTEIVVNVDLSLSCTLVDASGLAMQENQA